MDVRDINKVRDLISQGDDIKAIEKLQELFSDNKEYSNNLLLLLSEFRDLKKSEIQGTLSLDETRISKNRLRIKLIGLADSKIASIPVNVESHEKQKLIRNLMNFGSMKESRSILMKIVWIISFFYSFFDYPVVSGYSFVFENGLKSNNYLWQLISIIPTLTGALFFTKKLIPSKEDIITTGDQRFILPAPSFLNNVFYTTIEFGMYVFYIFIIINIFLNKGISGLESGCWLILINLGIFTIMSLLMFVFVKISLKIFEDNDDDLSKLKYSIKKTNIHFNEAIYEIEKNLFKDKKN